jgi:hypothetical protein
MAKTKTQKSKERMLALEKAMFDAVNETSKKVVGDFTVFEIVDVMTKVMHNYNKIGLDQQHKDYGDETDVVKIPQA